MSNNAMSARDKRPTLGLIEGFYGRQWNWGQRCELASELRDWGYRDYVYAPKGDTHLRSAWQQTFPRSWRNAVSNWANCCTRAGIRWGLGLSPVGMQARFGAAEGRQLGVKLAEIAQLKPDILWILFDDLPAGNPNLAANQIAVMNCVRENLPGVTLGMCPSYYSDDPVLDEVFGQRPAGYFEALAAGLTPDIDVLWTGPKVISECYSAADMQHARHLLGRKPLLWDNYPVNDGRKSSRFLNLLPFSGRPSELSHWTRGHYVNPMNQFYLSKLVLAGLGDVYRLGPDYCSRQQFDARLRDLPAPLATLLRRDARHFQTEGLDALDDNDKRRLVADYDAVDHPMASEISAWLQDAYRFDPACLTE